ncbi:MAG: IS21 family transposase [Deltaproteobacteria bacterium]|nr:IS21 family transposase [Deltaproteobacteria bacterium]
MWEVLDVLKRIHAGAGIRTVARQTGRGRNTVKRYVRTAEEVGWVARIHEPDEDLAQDVVSALQPGPKDGGQTITESVLAPHHCQIELWLKPDDYHQKGLQLTKAHQLLAREGVKVSYSALYRYAVKHLGFAEKTLTMRMEGEPPGKVAEIDFGRLGLVMDPDTGKRRTVYALIVTLVYSRHQYVHACYSQKLADVIAGLDDAWEFFGGVPARVIVDNMKTAVVKADKYEPVFNRTFGLYSDHHSFTIDAAESESPKHKPHVERSVQYVRENFFKGEKFLNLADVQRRARKWCLETAGMRIHGTTQRRPFVEFEAFEKETLNPANEKRFDTPQWAELKVHPDSHVQFKKALYSVPYAYRGKTATVQGDSQLVRIYIKGQLVKTHPRKRNGERSTDYNDYPKEKAAYAMRDSDYIIKKARERGEQIGIFAEQLLSGDFPWANLRQSHKLMRLYDKYGYQLLESACCRALSFDAINVRQVENIIINALENKKREAGEPQRQSDNVTQLPLRFLRDNSSFKHSN